MTIERIRPAAELFYDLQKLRVATDNRHGPKGDESPAVLDPEDAAFLKEMGDSLELLEKQALKHAAKRLKGIPVYEQWLKHQRGVGPTMSAVVLSAIDIVKADTASKIWAYAGLDVMADGRGRRRIKGERIRYNPWLKTKLVGVLADVFIRVGVPVGDEYHDLVKTYKRKEDGTFLMHKGKKVPVLDEFKVPVTTIKARYTREECWRHFYDDYKHRKQSQLVPVCMACEGRKTIITGKDAAATARAKMAFDALDSASKAAAALVSPCENCDGTGGPAPWGRSDGHRNSAAKRYMIKMFLLELWKQWRRIEGLEVRPSYQEQYLGHKHS